MCQGKMVWGVLVSAWVTVVGSRHMVSSRHLGPSYTSLLSVAGVLSRRHYGQTVGPCIKAGMGMKFSNVISSMSYKEDSKAC